MSRELCEDWGRDGDEGDCVCMIVEGCVKSNREMMISVCVCVCVCVCVLRVICREDV